MKTYNTAEIAKIIGVHPNTVRFYEGQELLPEIPRKDNGYRIYSDKHLLHLKLIRLSFRAEILSSNLRKEVIGVVKIAAGGDYDSAVDRTIIYKKHIHDEIKRAYESIELTEQMLSGEKKGRGVEVAFTRREAAGKASVSADVLRNWERNGLLSVPRKGKRRQYGTAEMNRIMIISVLRHANYSQMSIRRMLSRLDKGETDLAHIIDTPEETEDIISVADRYITSLNGALSDSEKILTLLKTIKQNEPSSNTPL